MKNYLIGVDGGGSKTRMILGDSEGRILADVLVGASNHQQVGPAKSECALKEGLDQLLTQMGCLKEDLRFAFLGLSGADVESDFALYNEIGTRVFGNIPFEVSNDTWLVMRAGLNSPIGSIAICGTGANAATCDPNNRSAILRQLVYEIGAYGGSMDIAKKAFHLAFRSNELTGQKTRLESTLPSLFDRPSLENCIDFFYPEKTITGKELSQVTKLVFKLAKDGDSVCHELLFAHGKKLAQGLIGTMRQAFAPDGLPTDKHPVVLGGTLFSFEDTALMQGFKEELFAKVPMAYLVKEKKPPVMGAYLKALDRMGIRQTDEITQRLDDYCLKLPTPSDYTKH